MEELEELENIVDTFSVLISETGNKNLKNQLLEYQEEFLNEKEELEDNLQKVQKEYVAECKRNIDLFRI